jgi:hypothetical protein
MTETPTQLTDWDGALGPQSDAEPLFYELKIDDETVRLVGPSPGQSYQYDRDEFETLVANGEWLLANDDWENEVYVTEAGEQPY